MASTTDSGKNIEMAASAPLFRSIPSISVLLSSRACAALIDKYPRRKIVNALRSVVNELRERVAANYQDEVIGNDELVNVAKQKLELSSLSSLRQLINGTGIVLHTNLGRAQLSEAAARAAYLAGAYYTNLEYRLVTGKRGARTETVTEILRDLTGCEAALVVNNNAAAVLLVMSAIANGGEVIVSRGELVEIGGAFRVPDVISQGGAKLVEVGTTNKTRILDYANAVSDQSRILLKVHASNYRIVGFTSEVSVTDLAKLGCRRGIPIVYDLGSGALIDLTQFGLPYEPTAPEAISAGADLVTFSGDKLLGGPQCGIIIGKIELISKLKNHPLFRALRCDKMTLAALESTLDIYLDNDKLKNELPVMRMLTASLESLSVRAKSICDKLKDIASVDASIIDAESFAGGGTMPQRSIPSIAVTLSIDGLSPDEIAKRLRQCETPIVGMISDANYMLNIRTIDDSEIDTIISAIANIHKTQ